MTTETPTVKSLEQALAVAEKVFQKSQNWVGFYREILGEQGILRKLYPTGEQWAAFCCTSEYREIQRMLRELMRRGRKSEKSGEPTRVITVRLPKSLHESLRLEAFASETSINQLCIAKLMQALEMDEGSDKRTDQ